MNQEQAKQYAQVVAKCWADPAFKAELIANTNAALAAEGIAVPAGVEIRVVENSANVVYVVLPARPAEGELSDEDMTSIVSGGSCYFPGEL